MSESPFVAAEIRLRLPRRRAQNSTKTSPNTTQPQQKPINERINNKSSLFGNRQAQNQAKAKSAPVNQEPAK